MKKEMNTGKNIIYFPPFDNLNELNDHRARASWYLGCLNPGEIVFPIAPGLKKETDLSFHLPQYLDESVLDAYEGLKEKFRLLDTTNEKEFLKCFEDSPLVMQWQADSYPSDSWKKRLVEAAAGEEKQVWKVDHNRIRFAGSFYIKAGFEKGNFPRMNDEIGRNRKKFEKMVADLGTFERSVLFLTGPMAAHYKEFDYSGALPIICNSTIFDEELLNYIKPRIMTIGDPIFHFGISRYAATFRARLFEVLERHKMYICIPFNYYRLFVYHFPQYEDITIGIPFNYTKPVNFNLARHFYLNPYSNILTMLMLPLGTTFADRIDIVGADGKQKSADDYFWSFNPKTQINDKMDNIQEAHPAFFAIDYSEYYEEHIASLADFLARGRRKGKTFHMLTPSYIPCLRQSYTYRNRDYEKTHYPLVSVIMPCFNNGNTIEASVDSVLRQEYPNWELIIVDEASGEDTQEVLRKIGNKDQRIEIIHKEQKNAASARNKGIDHAGGEYIAFLDSDDIYYPGSLGLRMEALIVNNYDAVFGSTEMLDENLRKLNWRITMQKDFITFLDLNNGTFHISSLIIKKRILVDNGRFDDGDAFYAVEDLDLLQRLARAGVIFHNVKKAETGYRQNASGAVFSNYLGHANRVKKVWDIIYSEDPRVKNALEEYTYGLGQAMKLEMQSKRQFQALIWLILGRDFDEIDNLCRELSPVITYRFTSEEVRNILRAVITRYHRCPRDQWEKYYFKHKSDIIRVITNKQRVVLSVPASFFHAIGRKTLLNSVKKTTKKTVEKMKRLRRELKGMVIKRA